MLNESDLKRPDKKKKRRKEDGVPAACLLGEDFLDGSEKSSEKCDPERIFLKKHSVTPSPS